MGLEEGGRGKESDGEQYPNTLHVCREMTRKCTGSCGIIGRGKGKGSNKGVTPMKCSAVRTLWTGLCSLKEEQGCKTGLLGSQ
jgi:hypothetical protein